MLKQRKHIRLINYDYSQSGLYFVTICTENRECLLGNVINEKMILNDVGNMIKKWWNKIQNKFNVISDENQIMPNHIHTIIHIVGADPCVRPNNKSFVRPNILINGSNNELTRGSTPTTIGTMIQWFKTMSTNEYIKNVNEKKWKPFNKRLWQRNYYEHIIRNENELNKIRQYIKNNPLFCNKDVNNPINYV